jgi:hypothetical protein
MGRAKGYCDRQLAYRTGTFDKTIACCRTHLTMAAAKVLMALVAAFEAARTGITASHFA